MNDIRHKIPPKCVELLEDARLLLGRLDTFHIQSSHIGAWEITGKKNPGIYLEITQAGQYLEKAHLLHKKITDLLHPVDESHTS